MIVGDGGVTSGGDRGVVSWVVEATGQSSSENGENSFLLLNG